MLEMSFSLAMFGNLAMFGMSWVVGDVNGFAETKKVPLSSGVAAPFANFLRLRI